MADQHSAGDESRLPETPVIAGVIPGQSPRVVVEAARYASMLGVGLVVVHVDVTRFVTYEDPDGYVHTAPIDLGAVSSAAQLEQIRATAAEALASSSVDWTVHQLVGDPALAIKHLADRLDAKLLVVGTRRRGIGESIREFFTGSVAARLAHRQQRPVLVVPQGQNAADDEDLWPEP
ncbi:universal stress protein [Microbacterium sp. 2P01SA-2]|uniref:universal stress protein n=1 Tax=unclassified Microbacterium TaxID=2609290 RepID=UPI0039A1A332